MTLASILDSPPPETDDELAAELAALAGYASPAVALLLRVLADEPAEVAAVRAANLRALACHVGDAAVLERAAAALEQFE